MILLFLKQELRSRFADSALGVAWILLAPILQLLVFNLVFVHILQARVPGLQGGEYIVFLALGFWPWFAFSEAIVRGTTAITDHAAIAAKVAVPRHVFVTSAVLASFLLHGVGYVAVLICLVAFGPSLEWSALPLALLHWVPLLLLAMGIALLLASLQVFLRDLAQMIGLAMTLWFFLTPIIYSLATVSPAIARWMRFNPLTGVIEAQRALLPGLPPGEAIGLYPWLAALVALAIGVLTHRRLHRNLEEFA